ncbi:MAG TPA: zf-HC2 domain-containing protein [Terriglobales bacterium]
MKCEEMDELLPDYLSGKLNSDRAVRVEEHIRQCSECREEVDLWKKLALLPDERPSDASRARFQAMLDSYQEGRWEKASLAAERRKFLGFGDLVHWLRTPSLSAAWACVLVVAGFLGGRYIDRDAINVANQKQLAALEQELHQTSELVAISLLRPQTSAGERLEGVNWSTRVEGDPKVLDALQQTLRYDSSVDVRLAALDALKGYGKRPDVSRSLVQALQTEQSPLVQLALIDVLVDLRNANAVDTLKRLELAPNLDPSVRKHASSAIQMLSQV